MPAEAPGQESILKAETIMHAIDRWLSGEPVTSAPRIYAGKGTTQHDPSLRSNLVVEIAAEIEGWRPAAPPVGLMPDHANHEGERYCTLDCPRGQWIGHLLQADEALLPFVNAARNKLVGSERERMPGDRFSTQGSLEEPRWLFSALYGYLTSQMPSRPRADWMNTLLMDLELLIQR